MLTETLTYFSSLPLWELIAVTTALAYVILAAKENIWCWPAALVSTLIYTVIFYDVYLWMDSLLQVYYLVMAVFGWYSWRKTSAVTRNECHESRAVTISSWSINLHSKVISILLVISLIVGYVMATFTSAHFPYLDSATTVYAVFATYLVTQKVLENWLYWIVIDVVSIYLYLEKGLIPTVALFIVYTVIACIGYYSWRKRTSVNTPLIQTS